MHVDHQRSNSNRHKDDYVFRYRLTAKSLARAYKKRRNRVTHLQAPAFREISCAYSLLRRFRQGAKNYAEGKKLL